MILMIDNYDSFTFNIFHYFTSEGADVVVYRNDQLNCKDITELNPEAIIISPGPGRPEQAGNCMEIVQHFYQKVPILGICLGHQVIAAAFGAKIKKAQTIKHGKTSLITHDGIGLFRYLSQPLEVMRYHSLVVDKETIPIGLGIIAASLDDNEIMAIKHQQYPIYGLQFHPESIGTVTGQKMVRNFLNEIRKGSRHETIS